MKRLNSIGSNEDGRSSSEASELSQIVLTFGDNRLAGDLFGQFDQNLALIEKRIGIDAVARGNQVVVKGSRNGCEQVRQVLDSLYGRLQDGHEICSADVEGAIRLSSDLEKQLTLPSIKSKKHLEYAQITTRRKKIIARTPTQDDYIRAIENSDMVFGLGPAGTGKTFLAVAYAASILESGEITRLILSRPAVEAGERLGFLPGDLREKIDPYLRPLFDGLYEMMPAEKVERGLQSGMIEIAPLAFMRGRTLSNAIVILDEAQNTSTMQMKMFLTRLGEDSKMIITGDPSQIDLPFGQKSGLIDALEILSSVDGISRIKFTSEDVVRHGLVARIVKAYDDATSSGKGKPDDEL